MADTNLNSDNPKTVLLIHGCPEPIRQNSPLYKYFADRGYNVVAPYLFTEDLRLTGEDLKEFLEEKIGKEISSDVIVGVSVGGLIASQLAVHYHDAKLVMVASGPYVKTKVKILNKLLLAGKPIFLSLLFKAGSFAPTWFYSLIYKTLNCPKLTEKENLKLKSHIREIRSSFKSISVGSGKEVLRYIVRTDNSQLLRSLKNKTIIFSSESDIMMPIFLSAELNELIKNSKLIVNKNRLHYDVFNEDNFKDLDDFLEN